MKRFAQLFAELDATTSTRVKLDALTRYFADARPEDAAWAVYFLAGGKPRQVVGTRVLREFVIAASGLPEWLVDESYHAVGDFAETVALLLPPPVRAGDTPLATWVEERLLPLRGRAPADVMAALASYVEELDTDERFLLIKLIGGGFRVGVSRLLVTRALAQHSALEAKVVAQRMIGYTDIAATPGARRFLALLARMTPSPRRVIPILFSWRTRCSFRSNVSKPSWARWRTGLRSGSTTASARNWSSALVRYGCGRAARS
jgi:DNA ligase 1